MSLTNCEMDFNSIEKNVFNMVCELGREMIKCTLMKIDKDIMENRDMERYRHKGLKKTSIKTVLGTIEFKRAIYKYTDQEGKQQYIYLLDKYLKMETIGHMSSNLVEKIVKSASEVSYRKAAKNVSGLTGQYISHGGAWDVLQELGRRMQEREKEKVEKFRDGELYGDKEVEVIFEEVDGLYINMQGKDRPKSNKSRGKKEIKIGISYEGWRREAGKREAYVVENKKAVAGFMGSEEFKELRDASLAETYNMDKIKYRILNADGAEWAKNGLDKETDYFQLDKYHISEAIIRAVPERKHIRELIGLSKGNTEKFLYRIESLKYECGGESEKVEKLNKLQTYLLNNQEGLKSYKEKLDIPAPSGGRYYRNLGTMEHNVFDILGHRMKRRKASWSIRGANNMAKILSAKASGKLYEGISTLLSSVLPTRASEVFEEVAKQVKEKSKASIYPMHRGEIPFSRCAVTNGRKAIRRMFDLQTFTELAYK